MALTKAQLRAKTKYNRSAKGKASRDKYNESLKGKRTRKLYTESKEGRLSMANSHLKYAKKNNLHWQAYKASKWIFKIKNYE